MSADATQASASTQQPSTSPEPAGACDPAPKVQVNGVTLHYEIQRPATGENRPPLVLLHGFPLNARVWAEVAAITGEKTCTIRPNLRGFGRLTSTDGFTIASLAEDIYELLRQTGSLPCVLVGLSMGGYVALALAKTHPEAVAGLGLVDTRAGGDTPEGKQKRMEMIQLLNRGGTSAVAEMMYPNMLATTTYEQRPGVADALMRIMLDTAAPTIEHACLAMRDREDYRTLLPNLGMPATVIVGTDDRITPLALAREMAQAMPDAELVEIPEAGHMAPLEQPQAVADALLRLVDRVQKN